MGKICDISKYQGEVDWKAASGELDFCILRASIGKTVDARFFENAAGCRRYGVPFHAYHYLKACTAQEAREEADTFFWATDASGAIFHVIDCEYDPVEEAEEKCPGVATEIVEAFMERLRERTNGSARIALYIGHASYPRWRLDLDRLQPAYIWIPRWGRNDGNVPEDKYRPAYACDLWQYTSRGNLAGVEGDVDMSTLTGTKPMEFFTGKQEENKGGENDLLTNLDFASFCLKAKSAGWVYWYGTYGNLCTEAKYKSKKEQYPKHYTDARESSYRQDIADGRTCADCGGLIKAFFWTGGVFGATPKRGTNGLSDMGADSLFALCEEKGDMDGMPDIPGLLVHRSGHIGVYVGEGKTVDMRGFADDCVMQDVEDGSWTEWGKLPDSLLHYADASEATEEEKEQTPDDDEKHRFVLMVEGDEDVLREAQRTYGGTLAEVISAGVT